MFHGSLYDGKLNPTAQDDRQPFEGWANGQGIIEANSFGVGASSGMNSYILDGRGLVRCSFSGTTQGSLWLIRNDAQVLVTHAASDPTNPRLDTIGVRVYDSETGGDSSDQVSPVILTGTPTSGANPINRSGAAVWPVNFLPIYDAIVPNGATSSASFTYRDRRPVALPMLIPPGSNATPVRFADGLVPITGTIGVSANNFQICVPVYVVRRVRNVHNVRWLYLQGGTPLTGNWNFGLYDAGGQQISTTGATAFAGAAGSVQQPFVSLGITTTIDAGMYWAAWGFSSLAGGTVNVGGAQIGISGGLAVPQTGIAFYNTSGGTSLPIAAQPPSLSGSISTDAGSLNPGIALIAPTISLSQ